MLPFANIIWRKGQELTQTFKYCTNNDLCRFKSAKKMPEHVAIGIALRNSLTI